RPAGGTSDSRGFSRLQERGAMAGAFTGAKSANDRTERSRNGFRKPPMSLRISGKNLDVGDTFRSQVETRLNEAMKKYFDGGFTGRVTVEREGSGFRTECTIHLDTGI